MDQAFDRRSSTKEARFPPRPVHVRFLMEKWHWYRDFSGYISFLQSLIDTHFLLRVAVTRRTKGSSLGNSQKSMLFRKAGSIEWISIVVLFLPQRRSVLDHVPLSVKFIPYKLALGRGFLFFEYFGSSPSVSFHLYSILVYTRMLLPLEQPKTGAV